MRKKIVFRSEEPAETKIHSRPEATPDNNFEGGEYIEFEEVKEDQG